MREDTVKFRRVTVDVEIPLDVVWEEGLEGVMVEDFLDWALMTTDVTLDQLARYVISKLADRDE